MKLGAEPKKVAILAGLSLVGLYLFYTNVINDPMAVATRTQPAAPAPSAPPRASQASVDQAIGAAPRGTGVVQAPRRRSEAPRAGQDFRPTMKRRPEDRIDPTAIDPTLRLDLLARVQGAEAHAAGRNVFQFSAPPPPPAPKVEVKAPLIVPKTPAQIAQEQQSQGPPPAPVKPPPPPISLKYYGYATGKAGARRAFFLDGDDILVAGEGEIVKNRYRVVRFGFSSVVMEDVQSKDQQTLQLTPEAAA